MSEWQWSGLIFHILPERDLQMPLLRMVPGLTPAERYFINAMIALCTVNTQRMTDQNGIIGYLEANNEPCSLSVVKKRTRELFRLGVLQRNELPRSHSKPAVIYSLNDIAELINSKILGERETALNDEVISSTQSLSFDDPLSIIEGQESYRHSYSRKISHLILRRCSKNPENLGKAIPLLLHGYGETVEVIQRCASGIPPMDGSEDRLQQTLITMFKEHIASVLEKFPNLSRADFKNQWIVDMRQVCRTQNLKPSNGNILVQAKRLFQLRHNVFEIYFNPDGFAARSLNLNNREGSGDDHYLDEHDGTLHKLRSDMIEQYCLARLEPCVDEVIWTDHKPQMELLEPSEAEPVRRMESGTDLEALLKDRKGRIYRFYKIAFHERLFQECLDDTMGQLHKNTPSLLSEDRKTARLLAYMAQRICTRKRIGPFETTWGKLAKEIQPVEDSTKLVFQSIERVMKSDFKPTKEHPRWSAEAGCVVEIHGYCFKTTVPDGKSRRRSSWRIMIWRDKSHPYTGETGPGAFAAIMHELKSAAVS